MRYSPAMGAKFALPSSPWVLSQPFEFPQSRSVKTLSACPHPVPTPIAHALPGLVAEQDPMVGGGREAHSYAPAIVSEVVSRTRTSASLHPLRLSVRQMS